MEYECKCRNCKNYKGNCGNHFVDYNDHINYEIPSESCYVDRVGIFCFEPSDEYKKELFKKDVEKILGEYTPEQIEAAMKLLEKQSEEEKQPELKSGWLVTDMGYHSHKKKEDNDDGGVTWLA